MPDADAERLEHAEDAVRVCLELIGSICRELTNAAPESGIDIEVMTELQSQANLIAEVAGEITGGDCLCELYGIAACERCQREIAERLERGGS